MIVPAEQGETANTIRPRRRPIRSGARGDIDLSRELHDHISQTLNLLLLEMEIFKADQVGREGVLRELDRMQTSIRGVLANVRGILHDIRKDTATAEDLRPSLQGLATRLATTAERSEEHTSELQSPYDLVCRLLLEKKQGPRSRGTCRQSRCLPWSAEDRSNYRHR